MSELVSPKVYLQVNTANVRLIRIHLGIILMTQHAQPELGLLYKFLLSKIYFESWPTLFLSSQISKCLFFIILKISILEKLGSFRNNTITGCTSDCHVGCPEGTYRLPGMSECKPRLNCNQIKRLLPTKDRFLIGGGGVKRVSTTTRFDIYTCVLAMSWISVSSDPIPLFSYLYLF